MATVLPSTHSILNSKFMQENHPSPRRIRFAPLPDPRRSVLITDDGIEVPLPDDQDISQTVLLDQDNSSMSSSSSGTSKRNSYSTDPSSVPSTPGTATPASFIHSDQDSSSAPPSPNASPTSVVSPLPSKSSWPKPRALSLLRPFKRSSGSSSSSSHTLTPTSSLEPTPTPTAASSRKNFSTEEILTLGTINLFRASSRDRCATSDSETSGGWGLTRWTSAGSTTSGKTSTLFGSSPLARTQSTQSYQSKSAQVAGTKRPSSASGPLNKINRKGMRMLNGRVYGAPKRHNANPFANVRDEEPEFVEWGYGGMGSVKGARSAGVVGGDGKSRWERLHSSSGGAFGAAEATAKRTDGVGGGDDNLDDGSGMAWIKKRREQREREKKEKEERERKEETGVNSENQENVKQGAQVAEGVEIESGNEATLPHLEPPPQLQHHSVSSLQSTARPGTPSSAMSIPPNALDEHHLRAVNVPAPIPRHHRGHSKSSLRELVGTASTTSVNRGADVVDAEEKTIKGVKMAPESYSGSDSDSDSESEESVEREFDDADDSDDEEEEEEENARRRTALGAGVEKISRHKDEGPSVATPGGDSSV